jgi:hypothetical protein
LSSLALFDAPNRRIVGQLVIVREQRGSIDRGSRWMLLLFGLTKPHAGTAAISINELDTCMFEGTSHNI